MISSVVPVKFPVTRSMNGSGCDARNALSSAAVGTVRFAVAFSGRGSHEERWTRAAASESDRTGEPTGLD
jgi:hypothetical protein